MTLSWAFGGLGAIQGLAERVASYRADTNVGEGAPPSPSSPERLPDFNGASQVMPCGVAQAPIGEIRALKRTPEGDARAEVPFANEFKRARRSPAVCSSSLVPMLRCDVLTPVLVHPPAAACVGSDRIDIATTVATQAADTSVRVSQQPTIAGEWRRIAVPEVPGHRRCWQFDATLARCVPVSYAPRSLSAVVSEVVDGRTASRLSLPRDVLITARHEFRYDSGQLTKTTQWRNACDATQVLRTLDEPLGAFPYPDSAKVIFRPDFEGVVVIPVEIRPQGQAEPVMLLFSSSYGCYLDHEGAIHAMTFIGEAAYAFDLPEADNDVMQVMARRVMPGSREDALFEAGGRMMAIKEDHARMVRHVDGSGWADGPTALDGSTLSLKWVRDDAGFQRLFSALGRELTQQLDTMVYVLNGAAPDVIRLYRNFVPDDAAAGASARQLVRMHHDALARRRSDLETTFQRLTDIAAVVDFDQDFTRRVFNGVLFGMAFGPLADVPQFQLYDTPTLFIARHLVQGTLMAPGMHAAHVAGHRLADHVFHECGHVGADWADDVTPQPEATMAAHAFRAVYISDEWRGGTVDLAVYAQTLSQSTPDSVVNLASFNQLMRMLLPALDAGFGRDVFPGLLDGSGRSYSYEYLVSMLSEAHDPAQLDADLLDFYSRLAERGRHLSRTVY